ncbi:hypothetical protein BOTNAR_0514g00070 [Botryotinia narcissicola]|uniref:C2H2-type domain-containing protein n=1 Tax=Botryotinia narcissicola TaxID=278944 RepID=A0A4Z1HRP7_9HELO|nr:hypothetical protein BOTNAR_0514g00070 [Botryotinia narcissicola]
MPVYCALCNKSFKVQSDLDKHIQDSPAHKMSVYCALCNRSFNAQVDLDQHVRNSSAHKKSTPRPPQVQKPLRIKLLSIKQQKQVAPTKGKPAKPPQTLHIHTLAQTIAASSPMTPNIIKPIIGADLQVAKSPWSAIAESEYMAVLNELSAHCHSPTELKENGYILNTYNSLDYINSRKCTRCNSLETNAIGRECHFHRYKRNKWNQKRPYKCCMTDGRGCETLPVHDFQLPLRAILHQEYRKTPTASAELKFRAVTVDCEMAGIAGGGSEVILLCVVDYITGAVLLNRLVCPREKITQMRSSIHGISKSTLDSASLQGQTLSGWEEARSELWKYIDDKTILVGHALQHDLEALRIIHPQIVDSGILSKNAIGIRRIRWGLQTLCSELLNVKIRNNKDEIHDCLEDVLATREVVLFCTYNKEAFQTWVEATKIKEMHLEKKREEARQSKKNEQARKNLARLGGASSSRYNFDSDDEDGEILRWSDIAEDLGWPHPDTGYDPWSD